MTPARLFRSLKAAAHFRGRRIFDVFDAALRQQGAFRSHWTGRPRVSVFRDEASEKIVRSGAGVVLLDAHSAPFRVTQ